MPPEREARVGLFIAHAGREGSTGRSIHSTLSWMTTEARRSLGVACRLMMATWAIQEGGEGRRQTAAW
eukprot:scaffold3832_cov101-Isochrysis_galbana.AAC.2